MSTGYYCYVSSQTDTSTAKGITVFDVEPKEGKLTYRKEIELDNPVHMTTSVDGRFLYAITDKGVASFEILPEGELKRLNIGSVRGLRGCHISISPDGHWLFVSGHYDAKITVLEINPDGSVGQIACGIFHKGLGVTERDFVPHIRCTRLTPDGKYLCVSDNGLDQIAIYSFDDQKGSLKRFDMIRCKLQSGPGVMEFSQDGRFLYVMQEMVCKISVYSYSDTPKGPVFELIQTVDTLGKNHSDSFSGVSLKLSCDDTFLLCTNAGNNSLGLFSRDSESGQLTQLNVLPVSGRYPTDFVLFPDEKHIMVTNCDSDSITFFSIDFEKGLIVMNQAPISIPAPCCALMIKQDS
ncbi:MAG: lactonase family protein [Lachnospiraceae bacterium]|nr:lactonase family protein [Lachnospiraceae bacterium]